MSRTVTSAPVGVRLRLLATLAALTAVMVACSDGEPTSTDKPDSSAPDVVTDTQADVAPVKDTATTPTDTATAPKDAGPEIKQT